MPLTINLAVYGVGLVGSEFIKQVLRLRPIPNTRIRIVEISNSKKSVNIAEYGSNDAEPGIKEDWETRLSRSQTASNEKLLTDLPDRLKAFNNPPQSRLVLVDNTSSASVADAYPSLLKRGVSIVTPNKKAFSGSLDLWQQIVLTASEGGSSFLNEATVGAGLPVINTLKEMVGTGDEVWLSSYRYPPASQDD
jgi:homoserine dehydrogenase